jgi:hypothetical protein
MAISDYSTTAASNTAISGISLAENVMVPSDVNNALRQLMADIKAGAPYLSGTTYLIESTDAGAAAGPDFSLYRNSATPAAGDILGRYMLQGENSAGGTVVYAQVGARIDDPTSTSEDGSLRLAASIAGLLTNYAYMGANAAATATPNAIGLPLGQLSFPATQNASSDANTLDDYKEGTTTPTPTAGSGTFTTVSAALKYTKIGNLVSFTCVITITDAGTAASSLLLPLPFTAAASSPGYGRETASTGFGLSVGITGGSASATILKYDNTTIIATGRTVTVAGSFMV